MAMKIKVNTVENDTESVKRKSWDDFRKSGLLTFVNTFLHIFGWVIAIEVDYDDNALGAYPARTSFRGFPEESMTRAYERVTQCMAQDIPALLKDVEPAE